MAVALAEAGQVSPENAHLIAARDDTALYGKLVHGLQPMKHHWWWTRRFDLVEQGQIRRLLLVGPPGSAKSTWLGAFAGRYLGRHPDHSLLYFTSQDTMAKQFGGPIQYALEQSEMHKAIFPEQECRPDTKRGWSINDGMYLQGTPRNTKDPAFRALGYWASAIGSRAHGIILDDPLTQKDQDSETVMDDARRLFDGTIDNRLHPDLGWIVAIMTSWNETDFAHFLAGKG